MLDSNDPRAPRAAQPAPLNAERMQALLDYSGDILSLMDREGRLLYNSPAAQRLHGFAPEEFEGRSTFDFIHPDDASQVGETFQKCLTHPGLPVRVRYRYARKEGGWIWMEAIGVNMLDTPSISAVVVNSRDITDRVEAENAVRQSESHFRALFNHMAQGFALCRLVYKDGVADDFIYVEVNQSFTELTGLKNVVGRRVSEVVPGIREADPDMLERYERVVRTGLPERFEVYRSALKLWFSISVYRPMPGHFAAIFDVINERKQAEEERSQLERQLSQSQKMDSLGSLAGGVAHDMNNVLGSILMLASAHEAMERPDSPAQQAFATITKACQRGGDMVRRLLGLARHDLSEVKLLNLNALVLEEVLLLERTTLAQVRFSLDLTDDLRPIRGDSAALVHALMNLCVNAIDAMPHGGTLTLRTRNAEPGWIELEVVDSGIGMPREVLDKAMDPFFTTKSHGKGTGLGLSMVYNTMKAHGGTLAIESETGRGTRVLVRLPSCEGEEPEDAAPTPSRQEGEGRSLDVLLVDDDELIRDSIGPVLRAQGHRVVLVGSGEEALDRMNRGSSPDVVILDMNMPGLGGRGTLPRIRSLQPDVPVLLATGRAGPDALELSRAFTGVTLLPKPINASDLKAYLDTLQARPDR